MTPYSSGTPRKRVRHQNVTTTIPPNTDHSIATGQLLATYAGGQYITSSNEQAIWDIVSDKIQKKRKKSMPCQHLIKQTYTPYSGAVTALRNSRVAPTLRTTINDYQTPIGSSLTYSVAAFKAQAGYATGPEFLAGQAQNLIALGYERMRPDLTALSVPNFLLDIAQVKMLLRLWNIRRSVSANVAGANLNYQYGWRPTIGDISAAISSVRNLQEKLKAWNDSLNILTKKRALVHSVEISKTGTGQIVYPFRWQGRLKQTVHAFIAYRPRPIPKMSEWERDLRATLDTLGFELNPAIIWDAIPFSFVVDWFVNVGQMLDTWNIDTLELPIALEDSFVQYKQSLIVDSQCWNVQSDSWPAFDYPGASYSESFFHRMPVMPGPADLGVLGWRHPKWNQWLLALSLGTALRAGYKNPKKYFA